MLPQQEQKITMKRPTSFDIAALAGVSQATVSRALSGASSVSEPVRQRVFDAAAQLNYTVDINARKLRSKKINTIAVLVSEDLDHSDNRINPFFLPLIGSILDYANSKGVDVLMSLQKADADWGADYGFRAAPTALSSWVTAISNPICARWPCWPRSANRGWCSDRSCRKRPTSLSARRTQKGRTRRWRT